MVASEKSFFPMENIEHTETGNNNHVDWLQDEPDRIEFQNLIFYVKNLKASL